MALANVSLTDTYDLWRVRTNQIVTYLNALDSANVFTVISNSAPLAVSGSSFRLGTVYLKITPSIDVNDVSTTNIASSSIVNTTYQLARTVYGAANAAPGIANTFATIAYNQANAAYTLANNAYLNSNTATGLAIGAFAAANVAASPSSVATAYTQANNAYITAQGAFNKANTAASTSVAGISEFATASEFRIGTDNLRSLVVDQVWASAAEVALTDAATITIDGSTFINANVTLGGNRILGTWANAKQGQSGYIRVIQDGTGSRTLAYHSDYRFASNTAITLTTTPNAQDMVFYQVITVGRILLTAVKAI